MTDKGIFKHIWRINAVLVLIVGVGFVYYLVGDLADNILGGSNWEMAEEEERDPTLRLSRPFQVGNGEYYMYALSPGGRVNEEGHWQVEPIRNFLVVNAQTNESSWLLPDTSNFIMEWEEITMNDDCGWLAVGLQVTCVPEDTDGNGERDPGDQKVILVSTGPNHEPRDLVGEPVGSFWCEVNGDRLFCQFRTARGLETAVYGMNEVMPQVGRSVLPDIKVAGNEGG